MILQMNGGGSVASTENSQHKHKGIKPQIGMYELVVNHQKYFHRLSFTNDVLILE